MIPGEDQVEYDTLHTDLHECYEPANTAEKLLVDQICASAWRLQRAQKIEAASLTRLTRKEGDSSRQLAYTLAEEPEILLRLQRYLRGFERAYYKAISELRILQKERAQKERAMTQQEIVRQQPNPMIATWAAGKQEIGFVSQEPATASTCQSGAVRARRTSCSRGRTASSHPSAP
ncbi:MAG: hypothetical protein WKF37_12905 [Bryobacteraceae bacterium]